MRRASSVDASLPPSANLHPALQAALGSLDVQLEAELTRYRRQRHIELRRQRDVRPMNVIAVSAVGGRTQPPSPPPISTPIDSDPWQTPSAPLAVRTAPAAQPLENAVDRANGEDGMASIAPDPVTVLQPNEPADEPDDYLASSEELLRSLAAEEADLRRQRQAHLPERILTPLGIGSLLLLLLSSATLGYLVLNPATVQGWKLDQFWSSRSPESAAVAPSQTPESSSIASPDLSSEEFHDLNLETLSTLPSPTPTPAQLPDSAAITPPIAPSPSGSTPPSSIRPAAQPAAPARSTAQTASPQPATPRVTVSRTAGAASPAPATRPATRPAARPAAPTQASRSTAVRPERSTQPAARPPRTAARPQVVPAQPRRVARPASLAPAAVREATPARYYVVSDYSGDRSLEQAQRVVGDAYVRNFPNGARVQLGAFSDAGRARELSQQLQQQGISAQVVEQSGP